MTGNQNNTSPNISCWWNRRKFGYKIENLARSSRPKTTKIGCENKVSKLSFFKPVLGHWRYSDMVKIGSDKVKTFALFESVAYKSKNPLRYSDHSNTIAKQDYTSPKTFAQFDHRILGSYEVIELRAIRITGNQGHTRSLSFAPFG